MKEKVREKYLQGLQTMCLCVDGDLQTGSHWQSTILIGQLGRTTGFWIWETSKDVFQSMPWAFRLIAVGAFMCSWESRKKPLIYNKNKRMYAAHCDEVSWVDFHIVVKWMIVQHVVSLTAYWPVLFCEH